TGESMIKVQYVSPLDNIIYVDLTAKPKMIDWDGDGKMDLFVGTIGPDPRMNASWSDGLHSSRFLWHRNVGENGKLLFEYEPTEIMIEGKSLGEYFNGFVGFDVVDFDNDGDLDILLGSGDDNHLYLIENVGTRQNPILKAPVRLEAEGRPLDFHEPFVAPAAYADGDLLHVFVCSRPSNVYYLEAIGRDEKGWPIWKSPTRVTVPAEKADQAPVSVGYLASVNVVDWRNKGSLDIITGDENGNIVLFENE
ncbi:unnamed protein product, partial [marine sediment metagenome]